MSKLKLYRVTIEEEFYCLAENEQEAADFADEFTRDNYIEEGAQAHEVTDMKYVCLGPDDLLYHNLEGDISFADWKAGKVEEASHGEG